MKILETKELSIPDIKIITFARFCDFRGYFTESFRKSQFNEELSFLENVTFVQANESYSKQGVIRGLHFQWNPYMGKLIRTVHGRMVDIFLDIRKNSPYFGKASAYELVAKPDLDYGEWIWVPPGFAHGNYFSEDTIIEYFCSGEYSPGCEAGISPLSRDIDWSLCNKKIKDELDGVIRKADLMTEKDRNGFSIETWLSDERSENFIYESLK
jgi:dTDP-4-dehydrorhamnose 3,5-epimerase